MSLDAPRLGLDELRDLPGRRPVLDSDVVFEGAVYPLRALPYMVVPVLVVTATMSAMASRPMSSRPSAVDV